MWLMLLALSGTGWAQAPVPPTIPPTFTVRTVPVGGSVTMSVAAQGTPPLTYQWQRGSLDIPGATAASFTLNNVQAADRGVYDVVVTNAAGSARSGVFGLQVIEPPLIQLHPENQIVTVGGTATFRIGYLPTQWEVTGIQWMKNGSPVGGPRVAPLILANVQPSDVGTYWAVLTNAGGQSTSRSATLSLAEPPVITAQPVDQVVPAGRTVTLSVGVAGTPPFTVEWFGVARRDGSSGTSLTLTNVQPSDTTSYQVEVTNTVGRVRSNWARLKVVAPPVVTQQPPATRSISVGSSLDVGVGVSGEEPLTFQWTKDGQPYSTSRLQISSVQPSDAGTYQLSITNPGGTVTTQSMVLRVGNGPRITAGFGDRSVSAGSTVTFSVSATGDGPLRYQWSKDWGPIPGATNSTLTLTNVQPGDAGLYQVGVSNDYGSLGTGARLAVGGQTLFVTVGNTRQTYDGTPKSVTIVATEPPNVPVEVRYMARNGTDRQPSPVAAPTEIGTYTFTLHADARFTSIWSAGDGTLTIVAPSPPANKRDQTVAFTELPDRGANSPPFTVSAAATSGLPVTYAVVSGPATISGNTVTLTDATGTVILRASQAGDEAFNPAAIERAFAVTATPPPQPPPPPPPPPPPTPPPPAVAPTITSQPTPTEQSVTVPAPVAITVAATGSEPLRYQWYQNGNALAGATDATLRIAATAVWSSGTYHVVVSNADGSVTSANAVVVATRAPDPVIAPSIVSDPPVQSVLWASETSIRAIISGSEPLSYQWRKNGVAIPGATNAVLVFLSVRTEDAGEYSLVVSNSAGTATSNAGRLLVSDPPPPASTTIPAAPPPSTPAATGTATATTTITPIAPTPPPPTTTVTTTISPPAVAPPAPTQPVAPPSATTTPPPAITPISPPPVSVPPPSSTTAPVTATAVVPPSGPPPVPPTAPPTVAPPAPVPVTATPVPPPNTPPAPGPLGTAVLADLPTVSAPQLLNLSTRAVVAGGADAMIAGFVVSGDTPKPVMVRAIGPALGAFGLQNAIAAPKLELFRGADLLASNNGLVQSPDAAAITAAATRSGAFALSPTARDAVLLFTLAPGSYTALVSSNDNVAGVALVEIYDVSEAATARSRLINLATRGVAGGGDQTLTAGFVLSGTVAKRVLVRGIGPALAAFGVVGALADPRLRVFKNGAIVANNDDWSGSVDAAAIVATTRRAGAFELPASGKDAALLLNLEPGAYTVELTGPEGAIGIALIEIYEVPE